MDMSEEIGNVAGVIWQLLKERGESSISGGLRDKSLAKHRLHGSWLACKGG